LGTNSLLYHVGILEVIIVLICSPFKKEKNILPNGGLMMIYHDTIRKKFTNKNQFKICCGVDKYQ